MRILIINPNSSTEMASTIKNIMRNAETPKATLGLPLGFLTMNVTPAPMRNSCIMSMMTLKKGEPILPSCA